MRSLFLKKIRERTAIAMTELLLATVISATMIGIAFTLYTRAKDNYTNAEVLRNLQMVVENIRTYYAFESDYKAINSVATSDYQKRGFCPKSWKMDSTGYCYGLDNMHFKIASADRGNAFAMTMKIPTQKMCIALLTSNWNNVEFFKLKSSNATGTHVPITVLLSDGVCKSSGESTGVIRFK